MCRKTSLLVSVSAVAAFLVSASVSVAQSTDEGKASAASVEEGSDIDTVIVKGVGRRLSSAGGLGSRSNLDTPFTVNQVTAQEIKDRQAYSLQDVFATDASVSRNGGSDFNAWSSRLIIRGLPIDFANSVKVNGLSVYLFGVNLPLDAVEQVEMLKGASGFMYGFSAPGGIVNYVTKKPPTSGSVLSFNGGYRSDQLLSANVDVGDRVGADDRFGYRVNVSAEEGDTYTASHIARGSVVASVDAKLTDTLVWTAEVLYQDGKTQRPAPYISLNTAPYVSSVLPEPISSDDLLISNQSYSRDKFSYASTGLDWWIADRWKASFDLAHDKLDRRYPTQYFYMINAAGDYSDRTWDGRAIWTYDNAQAMIEGRFETGPISHQVVSGVTWQKQTVDASKTQAMLIGGSGNLYVPNRLVWTPSTQLDLYRNAEYLQKAVFVSDTLGFNDKWSLLLGARYTDYEQKGWNATGVQTTYYTTTSTSPTVALMYKPVAQATAYFSYVESLEPGGTVGATYANAYAMLNPLLSKQIELGFKLDRRDWGLSAALFQIDRGATYANAQNYFVQDGNLRFQGLELSGDFSPVQNLKLGASATYLDAFYEKSGTAWLVDRTVEGTAPFSASLMASYDVDAVPGLTVHADGKYTGETVVYQRPATGVTVKAPDYAIFNTGVKYRTTMAGRKVTWRADVQNLFDKKYWQGGQYMLAIGAARTFALNVQVDM